MTKIEYNLARTIIKGYYISTAYRKATIENYVPIRYYETIVWEYNNNTRWNILYCDDSWWDEETAIQSHSQIVNKYLQPNNPNARN